LHGCANDAGSIESVEQLIERRRISDYVAGVVEPDPSFSISIKYGTIHSCSVSAGSNHLKPCAPLSARLSL
jgi:hypothetical protein